MLRTPTGPIGALLESLVAPSLPFRAPLGLEIWAPGRALGGPIRNLGALVRVSGPLFGYRGISQRGQKNVCVKSQGGGPHRIFFPGPTAAVSGPGYIQYVRWMIQCAAESCGRGARNPANPSLLVK